MRPLSAWADIDRETRGVIIRQLDALTGQILDAHAWWAGSKSARQAVPREGDRFLLWGLDVFPKLTRRGVELYLLEVNVYPQLFRGAQSCDRQVDEMLHSYYLPALLRGAGRR
jgi:hypothetical protein